jgi:hypothetical protein
MRWLYRRTWGCGTKWQRTAMAELVPCLAVSAAEQPRLWLAWRVTCRRSELLDGSSSSASSLRRSKSWRLGNLHCPLVPWQTVSRLNRQHSQSQPDQNSMHLQRDSSVIDRGVSSRTYTRAVVLLWTSSFGAPAFSLCVKFAVSASTQAPKQNGPLLFF